MVKNTLAHEYIWSTKILLIGVIRMQSVESMILLSTCIEGTYIKRF